MTRVNVKRLNITLSPSQSRVLIRPFIPQNEQRVVRIIARIMALTEQETRRQLERVLEEFGTRHQQISDILLHHFMSVKRWMITDDRISSERQMLIGSYFTQEYSLESAALFNPSIVPHPDQSDVAEGCVRFILSLRATGEGHISSIVFRTGQIDAGGMVSVAPPTPYVTEPERIPDHSYDKHMFERKLRELDLENEASARVLQRLHKHFTLDELRASLQVSKRQLPKNSETSAALEGIWTLALSNYAVTFHQSQRPSERAIFPSSPSQSNGIEDARFVQFREEDGTVTYYATYSAFDGKLVLPQILETRDFLNFKFNTLNGPAVRNKGMALFPRKINGCYAMLSRQDNENIFLMFSDNIHFWYSPRIIIKPTYTWEFVQLGNCGSPIELDEGWLVLSHGVGPMRKYCIGAFLLDKENPSRVIGRMKEPLLSPNENEREGYVPNVVYTCGAMLHGSRLVIPYAMSDYASSFAVVEAADVLDAMA